MEEQPEQSEEFIFPLILPEPLRLTGRSLIAEVVIFLKLTQHSLIAEVVIFLKLRQHSLIAEVVIFQALFSAAIKKNTDVPIQTDYQPVQHELLNLTGA